MKVYVRSPEKMFMFWGHYGELFAKSVIHKYFAKICKRYGGYENTFLELKKAPLGSIMYTHICIYILHQNVHICSKWD